MHDYSTWYEKRRSDLTAGGLWLRGGEINVSFDPSLFPLLIVRLSTYRDTALSITHASLYQIATNLSGAAADFAYLPPPKDGRLMARDSVPWLLGTGTKRSWESFGLIAVSNSIVQELVNLSVMMDRSGIEKSFKKRIINEDIPLIILGGANAANTALLMHDESPVDGIFAGEDYETISQIFTIVKNGREQKLKKREILALLDSVPGFLVSSPMGTEPRDTQTTVQMPMDISSQILTENLPVFYSEENARSGTIRISEGCPFICSFCAESWQRKPYREVSVEDIVAKAIEMKKRCGLESIDLYSFNFNIHSGIDRIVLELSKVFRSVGLKSQRFDMIARQPEMIPFMAEAGKSSVTCGLEGISARMRSYLCKSLKTEDLLKSIDVVMLSNLRELKIFLIATGKESEDDFREFADLADYIASFKKGKRVNFSLTPLVRFPHTPLESESAPDVDAVRAVVKRIGSICRERGFDFREACSGYEYFISQILLRGDVRVWRALLKAIKKERFVYYDGVDQQFADTFRRFMKEDGVDVKNILAGVESETGYGEKNRRFKFGVSENFLTSVRDDCIAYSFRESCAGMTTKGTCRACGACDAETMNAITAARNHHFDAGALALIKRGAQREEVRMPISVIIPSDMLMMKQYVGGIIARAILQVYPDMVSQLRSVKYERTEGDSQIYSLVMLPEMKQRIEGMGAFEFLNSIKLILPCNFSLNM